VIAQLSDFHARTDDDSLEAVAAAVDTVLALRPLPDAVLVSGDLADQGRPDEYAAVRERLAPLPMPVHAIPGNHDDRDAFTAAFGAPHWAVRCGPLRLVGCDSLVAGSEAGRLGDEQLAWLDAELGSDTTPTVVAMHHPPMVTGIDPVDAARLADADALRDVLGPHPHVRLVVTGHAHRAIAAPGVFVCPGVNLQTALDLTPGAPFQLVREPPAIAVHVLAAGEVVTHLQPVYRP
jgi:3',5'-cyclic-AMP phosphodiesterase